MAWAYLLIAGLCEVIWALSMKFTDGFTKLYPSIFTIIFMAISLYLLTLSTRYIPISIAYTVWVGIGAVGAALGSLLILKESISILQVLFIILIIIGVIGVKLAHILNCSLSD
jgi:quaternary ammonium compound-resistance protein SugE